MSVISAPDGTGQPVEHHALDTKPERFIFAQEQASFMAMHWFLKGLLTFVACAIF